MRLTRSARYVCVIPVLAMLLLVACCPPITTVPQAAATVPHATQEPAPLPLSEPGPYHVGMRTFTREDASRDNRQVGITV
jgi:hypothetical protein